MNSFFQIEALLKLRPYLDSANGALYFTPEAIATSGTPLMVRHFNRDLPSALIKPYVSLSAEASHWIQDHSQLASLVRIEQPVQVGRDFIARRYYLYHTSTRSYISCEDPPEPPPALWELREAFCSSARTSYEGRSRLVINVLSRSILEPSGKTFFEDEEGRFIVVDLKVEKEELEQWERWTDDE